MSDADLLEVQLSLLMRGAQGGDSDAYRALLTAVTPRCARIVLLMSASMDAGARRPMRKSAF